jgi:phage terminase large subunit-like protein
MPRSQQRHPRKADKPAEPPTGPPVLNDEQVARKAHLLSRFRHFAKAWQGSYYYEQPHDEQADVLEACKPNIGALDSRHKQIFLAPRYSMKTSMLLAFMVWCILWWRERGVDISIDYVRATIDLAEDVLFELKAGLETKPFMLELWGDLSKEANLWSGTRINLGTRRDHTVSVAGLDKGLAGKHPDLVILDDMVNDKNFDSIKSKRAGWMKLQHYLPALAPWGSLIVSGTRFSHTDVYGRQLKVIEHDDKKNRELLEAGKYKEAQDFKAQWDVYVRSVQNSKGDYYFPGVLSGAFLADQKRSMEARLYAANYLNQPYAEGMMRFPLDYLVYFSARFERLPVPTLEIIEERGGRIFTLDEFPVRVTMTIDPTVTANRTSDWTGITVVATDADEHWWVLLAHRYLEVPSVVGEKAVDIIRRYLPAVVQIESANADVDMVKRIQRAISDEKLPCRIESYHPVRDEAYAGGRRKKNARIEALEPRFRNGKISLHRHTCEALYEQYRDWPDVEHDDVFDSLAMHYGIAKPCQWKTVGEATEFVMPEEDDEPGQLFDDYTITLRDRAGNSRTITVPLPGQDEEGGRRIGRAGIASQRLAG